MAERHSRRLRIIATCNAQDDGVFAFRRFLSRFRGGVPGAPLRAGVPLDRRAELEAELAVVFDLLEAPQREAAAIVSEAQAEAARRRSRAAEEAAQLIAQADHDAGAEQSAAAASLSAKAEIEGRSFAAAAQTEADRIERTARERAPAVIEQLAGRILEPR